MAQTGLYLGIAIFVYCLLYKSVFQPANALCRHVLTCRPTVRQTVYPWERNGTANNLRASQHPKLSPRMGLVVVFIIQGAEVGEEIVVLCWTFPTHPRDKHPRQQQQKKNTYMWSRELYIREWIHCDRYLIYESLFLLIIITTTSWCINNMILVDQLSELTATLGPN